MAEPAGPVLDNHLHLNPAEGAGLDAVRDFVRAGGTHLIVVNRPSWHHDIAVESAEDFRAVFTSTLEIVVGADDLLPGRCWAVLGVHPGLISRLVEQRGFPPGEAAALMCGGLDTAATFLDEPAVLGLKSGRPHYEVTEAVWNASNTVLCHAIERAASADCALQLHTEATEDLTDIAEWADQAGLDRSRIVKHYAAGALAGPIPSVMSNRDRLERAANRGDLFLMETDYLDDPDRPGAVLGPKTVPRRVAWLREKGYDRALTIAHEETPRTVYDVDTRATLTTDER